MTGLAAHAVGLAGRIAPTDLSVQPSQMVAVIGPNGGGKTSLLRSIAGVEDAIGRVEIDGETLASTGDARRRRLLSFLPTSRDIAWPIHARDIIALGLSRPDEDRVDKLVDRFELQSLQHRSADRLSTGERARVMMARALASRPRVLLLDEPLSNLDPYWVLRFLEVMQEYAAGGAMVVASLHDLSNLHYFHRALLVADGKVQMDETPANLMASERFEKVFRISRSNGGWSIRH